MNKDFYADGRFFSFSEDYFVAYDRKFTYDEVVKVQYAVKSSGKRILHIWHLKVNVEIGETEENKDDLAEIRKFIQQKINEAKPSVAEEQSPSPDTPTQVAESKQPPSSDAPTQTSEPKQPESIEALLKEQISIQKRIDEHLFVIKVIIIVIIGLNVLVGIVGCNALNGLNAEGGSSDYEYDSDYDSEDDYDYDYDY